MNFDKFKLKNYTTGIPADKSMMEIEQMLAAFGAQAVMKQYLSDGRVFSIAFKIEERSYKLPANIEGVHEALWKGKRERHGTNNMKNREEQSYRVAWRIIRDWLHSQLSLMASGQAQPDQILMPYMYDGKRTLYEAYKAGTLQIGEGKDEQETQSQP